MEQNEIKDFENNNDNSIVPDTEKSMIQTKSINEEEFIQDDNLQDIHPEKEYSHDIENNENEKINEFEDNIISSIEQKEIIQENLNSEENLTKVENDVTEAKDDFNNDVMESKVDFENQPIDSELNGNQGNKEILESPNKESISDRKEDLDINITTTIAEEAVHLNQSDQESIMQVNNEQLDEIHSNEQSVNCNIISKEANIDKESDIEPSKLEEIRKQLEEKDREIASYDKEINKLEKATMALRNMNHSGPSIEQLEEEFSERIEKLEVKINELEREKELISISLKGIDTSNNMTKEGEIVSLKEKQKPLKQSIEIYESQIYKINKNMKNIRKEIDQLNQNFEYILNLRSNKRELIKSLESDKKSHIENIESLKSINDATINKLESVQQVYKEKLNKKLEIKEKYDKIWNEVSELTKENDALLVLHNISKETLITSFEKKLSTLIKKAEDEHKKNNDSDEVYVKNLREELSIIEKEYFIKSADFSSRIESLTSQIASIKEQNDNISLNNSTFRQSLQQQIEELTLEINYREEEYNNIKETQKKQINNMMNMLERLKIMTKEKQEEVEVKSEELKTIKLRQVKSLERDTDNLKQEIEKIKQDISNLKLKNEKLIANISNSELEIIKLSKQKKESSKLIKEIKQKKEKKEQEYRIKHKHIEASFIEPTTKSDIGSIDKPNVHKLLKKQKGFGIKGSTEILNDNLSRKESELESLKYNLSQLNKDKDIIKQKITKIIGEIDSLDVEIQNKLEVELKLNATNEQYNAALELLGEKSESIAELQKNILELKQRYKIEIEQLISQIEALKKDAM